MIAIPLFCLFIAATVRIYDQAMNEGLGTWKDWLAAMSIVVFVICWVWGSLYLIRRYLG